MNKKNQKDNKDISYIKILITIIVVLGIISFISEIFFWKIIAKKEEEVIEYKSDINIYDNNNFLNNEEKKQLEKSIEEFKENNVDFNVIILGMIGKKNIDIYTSELISDWKNKSNLDKQGYLIFVIYNGELKVVFDNITAQYIRNDKINEILNKHHKNLENNISQAIVDIVDELSKLSNLEDNLSDLIEDKNSL